MLIFLWVGFFCYISGGRGRTFQTAGQSTGITWLFADVDWMLMCLEKELHRTDNLHSSRTTSTFAINKVSTGRCSFFVWNHFQIFLFELLNNHVRTTLIIIQSICFNINLLCNIKRLQRSIGPIMKAPCSERSQVILHPTAASYADTQTPTA